MSLRHFLWSKRYLSCKGSEADPDGGLVNSMETADTTLNRFANSCDAFTSVRFWQSGVLSTAVAWEYTGGLSNER